ncbi:hypothetical protein [Prosthecobacter dejongeii]|uniref:Uncharacterized protein n=1 Tax=Prosthecobacter dejongeii TaxID=48465 RepID=A0A7W8DQJ1_9BACT|nr:hypothetical protein [Prosthecobacter dejongeii]MBB5038538.1 hypothetical protein [Prosthecobacter dejongeii]
MSEPLPAESEVAALRQEIKDLRHVIKLMWTLLVLFLGYISFRACTSIYQFEIIFENMLGDKNKLPDLTKSLIAWSRAGDGFAAPASVILLIGVSLILPWKLKSIRASVWVSLICTSLLVIHTALCWAGTFAPLITVIKDLSGAE